VRNSHTDVIIMLILGTIGHLFKQLGVAPAPIVLGLILGNIAEMGYVQTILGGQALTYPFFSLFKNPLSHILIGMILFSAAWPCLAALKRRIKARAKIRRIGDQYE
jgi:putative tricarboxylic transport membrane protein